MKFIALLVSIWATAGFTCTTVSIPESQNVVIAKSYDWHQGHGAVIVNKKKMEKTALTLHPLDKPAKWESNYGSVTFNQHGREMPLGGINEEGLTVEIMWLDESVYPPKDNRPVLNELQWIQYQLDNFASVEEVIDHVDEIRVSSIYAKVHYLVCDPTGACATVEYLPKKDSKEGVLVTHYGNQMKVNTLTNSTYEKSVTHLAQFKGFGGDLPIPSNMSSLSRFVRASAKAHNFDAETQLPVPYAFEIMDSVGPKEQSKWHIVYEAKTKQVYFRTWNHLAIKHFELSSFDFNCTTPVKIIDMERKKGGEVSQAFEDYTIEANKVLIDKAYEGLPLPESIKKKVIHYPETTVCKQ